MQNTIDLVGYLNFIYACSCLTLAFFSQGEQSGLQKLDENDPMAQAYLKYMDALTLDPNNYLCNLHVGRMLIEQGSHEEAIKRLHQAAGLKPTSVESR